MPQAHVMYVRVTSCYICLRKLHFYKSFDSTGWQGNDLEKGFWACYPNLGSNITMLMHTVGCFDFRAKPLDIPVSKIFPIQFFRFTWRTRTETNRTARSHVGWCQTAAFWHQLLLEQQASRIRHDKTIAPPKRQLIAEVGERSDLEDHGHAILYRIGKKVSLKYMQVWLHVCTHWFSVHHLDSRSFQLLELSKSNSLRCNGCPKLDSPSRPPDRGIWCHPKRLEKGRGGDPTVHLSYENHVLLPFAFRTAQFRGKHGNTDSCAKNQSASRSLDRMKPLGLSGQHSNISKN